MNFLASLIVKTIEQRNFSVWFELIEQGASNFLLRLNVCVPLLKMGKEDITCQSRLRNAFNSISKGQGVKVSPTISAPSFPRGACRNNKLCTSLLKCHRLYVLFDRIDDTLQNCSNFRTNDD